MTNPAGAAHAVRAERDRRLARARLGWIAAYVVVLLLPTLLMPFAPEVDLPPKQFALALGFATYIGMALQVVLASRAPVVTRPFGMDVLLRLHRYMGVVLLVLLAVHVLVFLLIAPQHLAWLYLGDLQVKAWTATIAFWSMVLLSVTSIWRRRLGWSYETWRVWHIALTAIAMFGAYVHMLGAGDFVAWGPLRAITIIAIVAAIAALVYVRFGRAFAAAGQPYAVEQVRPERGDAVTVRLRAHGHAGAPFQPGDFAWLRFAGAPYAITEHPFSVSSPAQDPEVAEFTCKVVGDLTGSLARLPVGATVYVDGPHGVGRPRPDAPGHVFVSAGIGITPVMSFIRTAAASEPLRDVPMLVLHGARRLEDVTFLEELEQLERQLPNLRTVLALTRPPDGWTGHVGRVDGSLVAREAAGLAAAGHEVFACGPIELLETVEHAAAQLGFPVAHVHVERFEGV